MSAPLALLTRRCVFTFFFFSSGFASFDDVDLRVFFGLSRSDSDFAGVTSPPVESLDSRSDFTSSDARLAQSVHGFDASVTSLPPASAACCSSARLKSPGSDVSESPSRLVSSSLLYVSAPPEAGAFDCSESRSRSRFRHVYLFLSFAHLVFLQVQLLHRSVKLLLQPRHPCCPQNNQKYISNIPLNKYISFD